MKVILTQDVEGFGEKNEVLTVAGGYARNFLIPRGMAKLATKGALQELEVVRQIDERKESRLRQEAEKTAEKLISLVLRIPAKTGTSGRLFGSVTSQDIADRILAETGIEVDRRKVHLEAPLKSIGTHVVPVTVFKGVTRDLSVEVFSEEIVDEPEEIEEPEALEAIEEPVRRPRRQTTDLTASSSAPPPVEAPPAEAQSQAPEPVDETA